MSFERVLRWTLVAIAIAGLTAGILARVAGRPDLADLARELSTAPVFGGLAVSIIRDLLSGRLGVDAIALQSTLAALALGQPFAGAVVGLMYSGGNVPEDIAVARAEHDLRSLVDRAPRHAHRKSGEWIEEIPIEAGSVGEELLVRAGEGDPARLVALGVDRLFRPGRASDRYAAAGRRTASGYAASDPAAARCRHRANGDGHRRSRGGSADNRCSARS